MRQIQHYKLEDFLNEIESILNSINDNKNIVLDIYMNNQQSLYKIEEDAENDFYQLIQEQLKDFFKNLKLSILSFEHSPFPYEREITTKTINNKKNLHELLLFLEEIILEIGGNYIPEIEKDLYKGIQDEINLEELELLKEQKDFLDSLVERSIFIQAELTLLLNFDLDIDI